MKAPGWPETPIRIVGAHLLAPRRAGRCRLRARASRRRRSSGWAKRRWNGSRSVQPVVQQAVAGRPARAGRGLVLRAGPRPPWPRRAARRSPSPAEPAPRITTRWSAEPRRRSTAAAASSAGQRHRGGPLDVVVEGAEPVAVAVEQPAGVGLREVLPLEQHVGKRLLDRLDERLDEVVVLGAARPARAASRGRAGRRAAPGCRCPTSRMIGSVVAGWMPPQSGVERRACRSGCPCRRPPGRPARGCARRRSRRSRRTSAIGSFRRIASIASRCG